MRVDTKTNNQAEIIDVVAFFTELIDGYVALEQNAHTISTRITRLTPLQIESACEKLRCQRDDLRTHDGQLVNILNIAGRELESHHLLNEYRQALANAVDAVDILKAELDYIRSKIGKHILL